MVKNLFQFNANCDFKCIQVFVYCKQSADHTSPYSGRLRERTFRWLFNPGNVYHRWALCYWRNLTLSSFLFFKFNFDASVLDFEHLYPTILCYTFIATFRCHNKAYFSLTISLLLVAGYLRDYSSCAQTRERIIYIYKEHVYGHMFSNFSGFTVPLALVISTSSNHSPSVVDVYELQWPVNMRWAVNSSTHLSNK